MIRRLRWKVIGLNMGMVFCVLLAVFAAVYFSSRAVIARSVQQQLQQVLQTGSGYDLSQPGQEGVPASWRRSTPAAPSVSPATATTT